MQAAKHTLKAAVVSHHGFDEEKVTMPVFYANLPIGVKDGLESACDYFDTRINQKFRSLRGVLLCWSIVCHRHVRYMLDRVGVHHRNIVNMMTRMRVWGCVLIEVIIIVVHDNLLAEVLLLWTGLLMIFTVIIGIVVLLVFHWMKGWRIRRYVLHLLNSPVMLYLGGINWYVLVVHILGNI
uniref:Uncharacterized protein n=1 Tax=Oryza rufipogon TaxID=4529 RepID=A0A0E0Q6X8_ORYRU